MVLGDTCRLISRRWLLVKNIAIDLCRIDICDSSRLGPVFPNGFKGRPRHDFVFLDLKVPVDEMESKTFSGR